MGNQIIRQPDGHYAIFCTGGDQIIMWDATADEIVEWFVEREANRAREQARKLVAHVAAGEPRKAYYQFAVAWDEALAADRKQGGDVWRDFEEKA